MRKKPEPEYRLRVFQYRQESGERSIALVVETIKEFVSFKYEVLLEDERTKNEIHVRILGLHAPVSIMPGTGPARGIRFYGSLTGTVAIHIKKLDGAVNEFEVGIGKNAVSLIKSPRNPFILFSSEPVTLET